MYTLFNCDYLEGLSKIADDSVDVVICDPPYGVTSCKWDSVLDLELLWVELDRVSKEYSSFIFTATQPYASVLITSKPKWFKYSLVWVKNRPTGAQQAKNKPLSKHEDILVFSKGGVGHRTQLGDKRMTYNPIGSVISDKPKVVDESFFSNITGARPNQIGRVYNAGSGYPTSVLVHAKDEDHLHPTQKPISLMKELVEMYSNEDDVILDFTMGSGSTGVAALQTGRRFVGVELDAGYFEIAKHRIELVDVTKRL